MFDGKIGIDGKTPGTLELFYPETKEFLECGYAGGIFGPRSTSEEEKKEYWVKLKKEYLRAFNLCKKNEDWIGVFHQLLFYGMTLSFGLKDYEKALKMFNKCVKLKYNCKEHLALCYYNRGVLYHRIFRKLDLAVDDYKSSIKLTNGTYYNALDALNECLKYVGDREGATEVSYYLCNSSPFVEMEKYYGHLLSLGRYLYEAGEDKDEICIKLFEKADLCRQNTSCGCALAEKCIVLYNLRKFVECLQTLHILENTRKSCSLHESELSEQELLLMQFKCYLYKEPNEPKNAYKYLQKVHDLSKYHSLDGDHYQCDCCNTTLVIQGFYTYHEKMEEYDLAIMYADQLASLMKHSPHGKYLGDLRRAQLYLKKGDEEASLKHFQKLGEMVEVFDSELFYGFHTLKDGLYLARKLKKWDVAVDILKNMKLGKTYNTHNFLSWNILLVDSYSKMSVASHEGYLSAKCCFEIMKNEISPSISLETKECGAPQSTGGGGGCECCHGNNKVEFYFSDLEELKKSSEEVVVVVGYHFKLAEKVMKRVMEFSLSLITKKLKEVSLNWKLENVLFAESWLGNIVLDVSLCTIVVENTRLVTGPFIRNFVFRLEINKKLRKNLQAFPRRTNIICFNSLKVEFPLS